MAVYGCATPDCKRMISSSIVPGGSPVAHADPEQWSLFGFSCGACSAMRCDRCAIRSVGACGCGQPLRLAIRPRPPEDGDAASTTAPAPGTDDERMRAFAATIAAQAGGELVEYSLVDFGRERRAGARTLLLDRAGRREGEQGIALVRLLRSMGLPPGVQVFANTLRNLGDDARHAGRDHVVFVASRDPFDVIRVADVDPVNHGLGAEDVVAQLMRWHADHGVEIVAADTETVVFRFLRMPEDIATLTEEIVEFCPDLQETFEMEPDTLATSPWVWLWWD